MKQCKLTRPPSLPPPPRHHNGPNVAIQPVQGASISLHRVHCTCCIICITETVARDNLNYSHFLRVNKKVTRYRNDIQWYTWYINHVNSHLDHVVHYTNHANVTGLLPVVIAVIHVIVFERVEE